MGEIKVAICRDCKWWEFLEEDPPAGDHGACHHPIAEAQYIAHMGEPAPNGLAMEGARRSCPKFEPKVKQRSEGERR